MIIYYNNEPAPKKGGWGVYPSTELNNIHNSVPYDANNPVSEFVVTTLDTMTTHEPIPLVSELDETSLDKFFARPRRVFTFSISTASVGEFTLDLALAYNALPAVDKVMSQYVMWRGKPTITVEYVGNPSVIGFLRMSAIPFIRADNYTATPSVLLDVEKSATFTRSSSMPHIDIDFSKPCTCRMELPWPHPVDYIDVGDSDWKLAFTEMSPLTSVNTTITATPLTFDIYVSYDDIAFLGLTPQGGEGDQTPWQSFLSRSSLIAAKIPFPYANVASKVLGMGSAVAGYMGWSRPMLEANTLVVARKHGNTALSSGQTDMACHAGLDPSTGSNVHWSQYPLGKDGDMKVSSMTGLYTQVTLDLAAGASLRASPIYNRSSYAVSGDKWYPTALAFASQLFKYWRGSLAYKLVIYSSPLIRWKIGVVIAAPGQAMPASFPTQGDYLTYLIDVVGTTEYEFEVPYLYGTPFQESVVGEASSLASTRWRYYSINTPTGPSATTATPTVQVYVKAGHDFELAYPTLDMINLSREQQGGRTLYTFGEEVEDWKTLCGRPVTVMSGATDNLNNPGSLQLPMDPLGPYTTTTPGAVSQKFLIYQQSWCWSSYLSRAFIGRNGGSLHRFTFWFDESNSPYTATSHVYQRTAPVGCAPYTALTGFICPPGRGSGDLIWTKDDYMLECCFPSRNNGNFKVAQRVYNNAVNTNIECVNVQLGEAPHSESIGFADIFSCADDFTLGGMMCIPALARV